MCCHQFGRKPNQGMTLRYSPSHHAYISISAPRQPRSLISNKSAIQLCTIISLTEFHVETSVNIPDCEVYFDWDICFIWPPAALLLALRKTHTFAKPKYILGAVSLCAVGGYLFYQRLKKSQKHSAASPATAEQERPSLQDVTTLKPAEDGIIHRYHAVLRTSAQSTCRICHESDTDDEQLVVEASESYKELASLLHHSELSLNDGSSKLTSQDGENQKKTLLEIENQQMADSGYVHSDYSGVYHRDDSSELTESTDAGIDSNEIIAQSSFVQLGEDATGRASSERPATHSPPLFYSSLREPSRSCNCSPKRSVGAIDYTHVQICDNMLKLRDEQLSSISVDFNDLYSQLKQIHEELRFLQNNIDLHNKGAEEEFPLLYGLPEHYYHSNGEIVHSSILPTSQYMPRWTDLGQFIVTKEYKISHMFSLANTVDEIEAMMMCFLSSVLVHDPKNISGSMSAALSMLTRVEVSGESLDSSFVSSLYQFYKQIDAVLQLPVIDRLSALSESQAIIEDALNLSQVVYKALVLDDANGKATPSFFLPCLMGGPNVVKQMFVHMLAYLMQVDLVFLRPTYKHTDNIKINFPYEGSNCRGEIVLIQQSEEHYFVPLE